MVFLFRCDTDFRHSFFLFILQVLGEGARPAAPPLVAPLKGSVRRGEEGKPYSLHPAIDSQNIALRHGAYPYCAVYPISLNRLNFKLLLKYLALNFLFHSLLGLFKYPFFLTQHLFNIILIHQTETFIILNHHIIFKFYFCTVLSSKFNSCNFKKH